MMTLLDTTYSERLSALLSQEEPDLERLQKLVTISNQYSQSDLEKLIVAAREEGWRDALRDAGFLASVADSLQAQTDVHVALQAIRFLTNELAYSDESRLIMLQSDRIARLAHWLQGQVTANTACLTFHNLFNTDENEEDNTEAGDADRSVTYQTRCSAIAQGTLRMFCQLTTQRARDVDTTKWDDWATMCSYLLECAIDHKGERAAEPPVLGSAQSLIAGFEGLDLLAPPADGSCRCANADELVYKYVCDLIAACAGMIEHRALVSADLIEMYREEPLETPSDTHQDNAIAAADLFKKCLEYLRAHQKELVQRPERLLYLVDAHNRLISEIRTGYQLALDDTADETDFYWTNSTDSTNTTNSTISTISNNELGRYLDERILLSNIMDDRLRPHRHQVSDLIGECISSLNIVDEVSLRSSCIFQAAVFGLGSSCSDVAELFCLVLGNLANNEKVARAMVDEHNIHLSLLKTFFREYKEPRHDLTFAASGLLCNLAIPDHQSELLQCAEGGEPQIYKALDDMMRMHNNLIQANGLRLLRLLCRSFEDVAWLVLGIAISETGVRSIPPRFRFAQLLADKPSRAIQVEAARLVGEIYKQLRAACKQGLEDQLKAQEATHRFETPGFLGNMINVCKMESNEATGVWLGLALIAQYSSQSAQAVYQALTPEREFFHKVATRSQEAPVAPSAPSHEQAAKHNAMVAQATSSRNAYSLAKILSDQVGDGLNADDGMNLVAWVHEKQKS